MTDIKSMTQKLDRALSHGSLSDKAAAINMIVSAVKTLIKEIEDAVILGREANGLEQQLRIIKGTEHEDKNEARKNEDEIKDMLRAALKAKSAIDEKKREARSLLGSVKELQYSLERVLKL